MNSVHFEHSPDSECPAIELDEKNFMKHLSDEYVCEKVVVRDGYVKSETKIIECKIEDCADFKDMPSISGNKLKQKDEVRILGTRFVLFQVSCKHCYV